VQLLALDLATKVGWACGDTSTGDPVSGVHTLPSTGDDIGKFAGAFDDFLRGMSERYQPKLIVIEEPMVTTAGRTTLATSLKLQGLCYHAELVAQQFKLKCRQVPAGTWKKAFCGPGAGKTSKNVKPYPVVVACRQRGWLDIKDDNEADARGLFVYACGVIDPRNSSRFDPIFRHAARAA
jgi:hypothetical protein